MSGPQSSKNTLFLRSPQNGWAKRALLIAWFAFVLLAIVSRRPDAVLKAQFWAEDGTVWFAQEYNDGLSHALLKPLNGDFQTFPRLVAAVAMLFPLKAAPLVMNVTAILVQALPAVFLLTSRFNTVANRGTRALMAVLMLGVPNCFEVHANVSNSMTFLALSAFLVFVADPPPTGLWRVFDVSIILLSGLTGAFSFFLFPVAAFLYFKLHRRWTGILLTLEASTALLQGVTILLTASASRSPAPL